MENQENQEQINLTLSDEGDGKFRDPMEKRAILQLAKEHNRAQCVNKIPEKYSPEDIEFCDCCLLPLRTKGIIEPYPYCVDIKDLSSFGVGMFLYFYFFKFVIFCLFVILGMCSIPTILISKEYTNHLFKYCNVTLSNSSICNRYNSNVTNTRSDWLYQMSYENLNQTLFHMSTFKVGNSTTKFEAFSNTVTDYSFITFLTMITLLIINLIFITIIYNSIKEVDYGQVTPADFHLLISKISKEFEEVDDIKTRILEINDIQPMDIQLTYKLDSYFNYQTTLKTLKRKYKSLKQSGNDVYITGCLCKTAETKEELKKNILQTKLNIKEYLSDLNNLPKHPELFNGVAFATFKDITTLDNYFSQFSHTLIGHILKYLHFGFARYICCCCYSQTKLKNLARSITLRVERAPEPQDIIWENLQYDESSKLCRKVIVYTICFLLLFLSFSIILGLNYFQNYAQKQGWTSSIFIKYFMSCLISCTISIINYVINISMDKLTAIEKFHSMTEFFLALSQKLTLFTFINSAVLPLVSNVINDGWDQKDILLNNLLIIFLSNAFFSPLYYLSNMFYFKKKWERRQIEKKYTDANKPIEEFSQKELNEIYEDPDMQISFKYSYVAKTLLLSVFYIPLFPIGIFISMIGVSLTYLVEKFNLLNTYKRPQMLNASICIFYINHFKLTIFVFSVGNWIFLSGVYQSNTWSFISIVVFGALLLLPIHRLFRLDFIGIAESQILTKPYDEYFFEFPTDYERANPITKRKGEHHYLEKLKEEGIISDDDYNKLTEAMSKESINMIELYYKTNKDMKTRVNNRISAMFKPKYQAKKNGINFAEKLIYNILGEEPPKKHKDSLLKKRTHALKNFASYGFENIINLEAPKNLQPKKKVDLFVKYKKEKKLEDIPNVSEKNNNDVVDENQNFDVNKENNLNGNLNDKNVLEQDIQYSHYKEYNEDINDQNSSPYPQRNINIYQIQENVYGDFPLNNYQNNNMNNNLFVSANNNINLDNNSQYDNQYNNQYSNQYNNQDNNKYNNQFNNHNNQYNNQYNNQNNN